MTSVSSAGVNQALRVMPSKCTSRPWWVSRSRGIRVVRATATFCRSSATAAISKWSSAAVELGPASKLWTTRATCNLTAPLERIRVDRQLEEALNHGAGPLHLALVFGIDEKTAIRYADSARHTVKKGR
ncbi:hypothetical protein [Streptomyces sp. NPDC088246]|uniref:hypothetical protein n=1 Tax=Streptomyces sp. NPDC088246 TaxID=3365842 RepID=UPI003820CA81